MNHCDEIFELLSLELDKELPEMERGRMQSHLADCFDCSQTFAQLKAVDTLFRQAPMKYAPLGFTERTVNAALDEYRRRNIALGLMILLAGTLTIGGLFVIGRADLIWLSLSVVLTPGFFSTSPMWLSESLQALALAGSVSLSVLDVMKELMLGPLLLPVLVSLLSAMFMALFIGRSNQNTLTTSG